VWNIQGSHNPVADVEELENLSVKQNLISFVHILQYLRKFYDPHFETFKTRRFGYKKFKLEYCHNSW